MKGALVAHISALFILGSSPSHAHRMSTRSGPPPEGVSIPSLTHGQMAVIRDNLPAIKALASARLGFDLTTWRLEDYLNLQSFACLWGIVPRSITDEDSPFNECSHAYLAAGRALLLQLSKEPAADHKSIDALISKIEVEMLADGASMNLCRYSDEPFNTNEIIWPHWGMAPFHAPTVATFATVFALIASALFWLARPDAKAGELSQPTPEAPARRASRRTLQYPRAPSRCLNRFDDARRSEHRVGVGRCLRDRLDHVPVLDDLAAFQAKDVDHRLSTGIIGQAVPMAVKDDVVAVGKDPLDLAMSIRMIRHDKGDELLHAFHPVFDERIVLAIGDAGVKPKGVIEMTLE
jgi:hypothetical protein